ncbi:hypothetical protein GUITHDRAFT_105027 [Guillardia theta CCMP2712]|uniref:HEAT repeat domain-containing protein n=1 Tax=Guillardia theta (strain CCMP2712) TaxID=905079 RepID=L1JN50_GUITC|nr:hypothetical protein GUITHDRAFT_105027 [Guillardia theta CCMP2712]EKX49503.1 hypothetical protein GUITHDRAFT_105027 [Guillardia theta CCMP2712]|eukprot:XP_005836483.1 hypothetical protein GUITHDRAFT_105027 [Guillardia theta CCMP2712]
MRRLRTSQSWQEKRDAIYLLRERSRKREEKVMALLEDIADKEENENLRSLAEASLISIGLKVVETQLKRLDHPSWRTRLDAIRTLQHAAEPDDAEVLLALGSKLYDESVQVRLVVIQALLSMAKSRKDAQASLPPQLMEIFLHKLDDSDAKLRNQMVQAVIEYSNPTDHELVRYVAQRMTSDQVIVRRAAAEIMTSLIIKFDKLYESADRLNENSPLSHLKRLLTYDNQDIQRTALTVMEQISSRQSFVMYTENVETSAEDVKSTLEDQVDAADQVRQHELVLPMRYWEEDHQPT